MANPFTGARRPLQIQAAALPTWDEAGCWQAVAGAAAQGSAGGWSWSIPRQGTSPSARCCPTALPSGLCSAQTELHKPPWVQTPHCQVSAAPPLSQSEPPPAPCPLPGTGARILCHPGRAQPVSQRFARHIWPCQVTPHRWRCRTARGQSLAFVRCSLGITAAWAPGGGSSGA